MNSKSPTSASLIQIALRRAYDNMNSSTRALLLSCQILITRNNTHWYITLAAPNARVGKRIVKRLESITRRFEQTLSSFILSVCTTDDPVPPGGCGVGRVQRHFLINQTWFVQIDHEDHPHWVEVAPERLLSPVEPQPSLIPGARYMINWDAIALLGNNYLVQFKNWFRKYSLSETSVFIFTGKTTPDEKNPKTLLADCQVEGKPLVVRLIVQHLMEASLLEADDWEEDEDLPF